MHLVAQFLDFGVVSGPYPLLAFERRSWVVWPWACLRPCPAPKPRDRRAARARETRGSLRRTLVARPALAVSIPHSLASHAKVGKARANGKSGREGGTIGEPNNPDMCTRFPLSSGLPRLQRYREQYGSARNSPSALGVNRKGGTALRRKVRQPCPQADRRSRFLALIWAMRTGPSENSPSPAFRVNSRK